MIARPAPGGDAGLVRRVRWRLLAWSGGTTLLVLITLGAALYAAVASSLASEGVEQLERRAELVAGSLELGPAPAAQPFPSVIARAPGSPGIDFLGPTAGTFAFVVGPSQPEPQVAVALPLPEPSGLAAARAGQRRIVETTLGGTPARVLSVPVDRPEGRFVVQVVGDRTAEVRALGVLLTVLAVGGLLALAAALAVGWLYAERALVPIRDALRRQREFAADASHELRTPLAIVRGSIEHLRRHRDRPVAEVGDALDDMEAEIGRLNALVDDLLLLARTDSGAVELATVPVELAEVALDAAAGLSRLAESRDIRLEVDAAPVEVDGDPARLRQLVTILVDNAVRYAPAGSRVAIVAGPADGGARLAVEDEGPGFRLEDLPRVFDRFWRAPDAPAGGTGLGLAIAAWIVERHGGRIVATNRPGGGARLEVSLPRR